jgi:hypothetical protein
MQGYLGVVIGEGGYPLPEPRAGSGARDPPSTKRRGNYPTQYGRGGYPPLLVFPEVPGNPLSI